jgi:hypothetical protein
LAAQAANDPAAHKAPKDQGADRRRAKALALLEQHPDWRIAVVVETGSPAIVGVAIRGVAYGEIEIPAEQYDAFALLALMERHGAERNETMH